MDKEFRHLLDNVRFDVKKCNELLIAVNTLFNENNVNSIEQQYIISILESSLTGIVTVKSLQK